jgi:Na+/H+ antiporter NhaC
LLLIKKGGLFMKNKQNQVKEFPLEFRGSNYLSLVPLLIFAFFCVMFFVVFKVFSMEALAMGGVVALIIGSLLSKSQAKFWDAVIVGMCTPMASTIALILLVVGIFGKMMAVGHVAEGFVWLGSSLGLHGSMFTVFTFIATSIIATATGTSIGTMFACFPILYPSGILLGANPLFLAGAILSGAIFGDNIGPISDTTIASASTQSYTNRTGSADIAGVVTSRMRYALVAAGLSIIGFFIWGGAPVAQSAQAQELLAKYSNPLGLVMLIPVVILLAIAIINRNIFISITWGIISGIAIGLLTGVMTPADIMSVKDGNLTGFLYSGILSMLGMVVYLYGVMGIMGVLQESGTLHKIIQALAGSKLAQTTMGTEIILGLGIMISSIGLGAANGPAIIMFGPIANELGKSAKLHPYRRANLLDGLAGTIPVLVPFTSAFIFIVIAIVSGLMSEYPFIQAINPLQMTYATLHSLFLFVAFAYSIATGWGRKYEGANGEPVDNKPGFEITNDRTLKA